MKTDERYAALLLRLLGIYFMAWAIISGMFAASRISAASRLLDGLDANDWFAWGYKAISLACPGAELIIGIYLLIGGQWVFTKILAPIARPTKDAFADEKLSDDHE